MKLTLRHFAIRSTHVLDSWIESQILSLQPRLQIDEATVRLARHPDSSPSYHVHVHLVTPGPDVVAEGQDHTLRGAFGKVMRQVSESIAHRVQKRLRRQKSNRSAPAEKVRGLRAN